MLFDVSSFLYLRCFKEEESGTVGLFQAKILLLGPRFFESGLGEI